MQREVILNYVIPNPTKLPYVIHCRSIDIDLEPAYYKFLFQAFLVKLIPSICQFQVTEFVESSILNWIINPLFHNSFQVDQVIRQRISLL